MVGNKKTRLPSSTMLELTLTFSQEIFGESNGYSEDGRDRPKLNAIRLQFSGIK
jgi:hypothetical protein